MDWQLLWHIAICMASPVHLDMQDPLCDPQSERRRRNSALQAMHSGAFERMASDIVVLEGWG